MNGRWKESSGEDIIGIRSGAGNEKKGEMQSEWRASYSIRTTRRIFRTQVSPRVRSGTELDNRLESLGEGVEDESV